MQARSRARVDGDRAATQMGSSMTTPPRFPTWDQLYKERAVETMPWFHRDLDADVAQALDRLGIRSGTALDLGTGPGTQAIALAKRGLSVTGTDLAQSAIERATQRAAAEGVRVRFVQDDILATALDAPFDLVLDRGCFHVIDPDHRAAYATRVHALVEPRGHFFLKTFSANQPGTQGPHRFAPADIRAVFEDLFDLESITDSVYQGTLDPLPIALFCVLQRR
jgi:2-polyprenyl-3-methyl-5-hydroxy-6-metoxy-1,4-benzoquinol methylase